MNVGPEGRRLPGRRWLSRLDDAGPTAWRYLVVAVAGLAVIVRVLIIAHSGGGADLRIYTYFSRLPLRGLNPFNGPANGFVTPILGNSPPLEVALFSGLLKLHNSSTTLRGFFALCDAGVILYVGFCFRRSRAWRLAFVGFYAFNPFVLFCWTVFAEDKTMLMLGIVIWFDALDRGRDGIVWSAAAALAALKFLGVFAVPVMALDAFQRHGRRGAKFVAAAAGAWALSNLLWFPKSLDAFPRRNARLAIDPPIHASPTIILSRLGIYAPAEVKVLIGVAVLAILAAFLARRIDLAEAVAWSLFTGYVFLPDNAFNRLLLIALPFMLILEFSAAEWLVVWVATSLAAGAGLITAKGVPHELAFAGGTLRAIAGPDGGLRQLVWMNLLGILVLARYFAGRRERHGALVTA